MSSVVYWNVERAPRLLRRVPRRLVKPLLRWENNAGDMLSPLVVAHMARRAGRRAVDPDRRLLAIGSILHFARPGDVVWGSGRNGRIPDAAHHLVDLDVRAVRGPLTREWLVERGIPCPAVYGDPALLVPLMRPDLVEMGRRKRYDVTFVSHIDDWPHRRRRGVLSMSARAPLETWLTTIVQSEFVIATSMHAVIVAEAFGIPARCIANRSEPEFKFLDYYASTGRPVHHRAASIEEALDLGPEPPLDIDLGPLIDAFPVDLFPVDEHLRVGDER